MLCTKSRQLGLKHTRMWTAGRLAPVVCVPCTNIVRCKHSISSANQTMLNSSHDCLVPKVTCQASAGVSKSESCRQSTFVPPSHPTGPSCNAIRNQFTAGAHQPVLCCTVNIPEFLCYLAFLTLYRRPVMIIGSKLWLTTVDTQNRMVGRSTTRSTSTP